MPGIQFLQLRWLPIKRKGLTDFTFGRYLCPYLCGYQGTSLFLDADMLCLGDIFELERFAPTDCAVAVVKNKLKFEWPSMMFFNNSLCMNLTPDFIETGDPAALNWGPVGELPGAWTHCVGYDEPQATVKLAHFTQGIPCFPETKNCEFSKEWNDELKHMTSTVSWQAIRGNSVHCEPVLRRLGRIA